MFVRQVAQQDAVKIFLVPLTVHPLQQAYTALVAEKAPVFEYVIHWAKQQQLHRLELTVIEHNHQAIHLYRKMSFKEEGIKRDSL